MSKRTSCAAHELNQSLKGRVPLADFVVCEETLSGCLTHWSQEQRYGSRKFQFNDSLEIEKVHLCWSVPGLTHFLRGQNGHHFSADTCKRIFMNENFGIRISLKIIFMGPIDIQIKHRQTHGKHTMGSKLILCCNTIFRTQVKRFVNANLLGIYTDIQYFEIWAQDDTRVIHAPFYVNMNLSVKLFEMLEIASAHWLACNVCVW